MRLLLIVCSFSLAAACQKKAAQPPVQPQQQGGPILLKPVGGARLEAERNQEISLKILATHVGQGPASALAVAVSFVGPTRGDLGATQLTTNDLGFASVKLTTPDTESATMQIKFTAPGAPPLTLTVVVGKEVVHVDFVGRNPRLIKRATEGEVVVSVQNQRGAPVAGVLVTLEMMGQAAFGALITGADNVLSDGSGLARFTFYPGAELTNYRLKATGEHANSAILDVIVADQVPEDNPCVFSSECAPGFVCSDGVCVTGGRRCRTNHDEDCAAGEMCSDENVCVPACPNHDCSANGVVIDVTGRWKTFYTFDLSQTMGVLNALGQPIAIADTLFQGKLPVDIPILGPIIEAVLSELIRQFVPDWVPKLASALNDLWTVFSDMTVYGLMELTPAGGTNLHGSEVWQRVEVKLASLCPRRQSDPQWPQCAIVNIQLNPNLGGGITAGATAAPFNGHIDGTTLMLESRQAELEIKALIGNLIDLVINIATNGHAHNMQEAIVQIIDCPNLTLAANDLACDITDGSTCELDWFEGVCNTVATVVGQMVATEVNKIPVSWQLLDFDQQATAHDDPPLTTRADRLSDGTLSGATNFFSDRPMTGVWQARR